MGHYQQSYKGKPLQSKRNVKQYNSKYVGIYCAISFCARQAESKSLCGYHATTAWKMGLDTQGIVELFGDNPECSNPNCSITNDLMIDHDHSCCPEQRSCGKCIRGLLCRGCNPPSLGQLNLTLIRSECLPL